MTKPRIRIKADVMRAAAEAYSAASWTHPDVRAWAPSMGSADADILPELGTLVRRSRDLVRNHGVAAGALQTIVDNVLGCGLWLAPTPEYTLLKRDRQWARDWRRQVKAKWRAWAETNRCDAAESLTLDGLATQIYSGAWQNGDGLALALWLPTPGYPAATRLQVIEADRLSNPNWQSDGDRLRGGIEINQYGAPQAYWIRKTHPGDRYNFSTTLPAEWVRIPAKTSWGRLRVIHAHDKGRAGQTRGVPAVASVLSQFKVLGDYNRAELKAAVVNAMVALITESAIGQEGLVELLSSNPNALKAYMEGLSNRSRSAIPFREGLIVPLTLGEKIASFSPARPTTAYEPFVTTVFRHIATGLNIPYELLMKDFSKTNYSSARAALLEAWRFFTSRREWLALSFYQPAYELWLEEMVNMGEIEAPDFYMAREAYCRARWIGPGRGWIDPLKEAQAAEKRMDIRVSSLERECAEQGIDWEELLEQVAEEEALMAELNVSRRLATDALRPGRAGDNTDGDDANVDAERRERSARAATAAAVALA